MLFERFLSAEEAKIVEDKSKADKKKRKALKKEIRRLSSDSVITKLREDLELSNQRAFHFEREFFNLQKSHETLKDCYQTINEADQQLKADLYELTKVIMEKDKEIAELTKKLGKQVDEITDLMDGKDVISGDVKSPKVDICGLTTDEVNDQINQLNKVEKFSIAEHFPDLEAGLRP